MRICDENPWTVDAHFGGKRREAFEEVFDRFIELPAASLSFVWIVKRFAG